jgi:hypothetical protein
MAGVVNRAAANNAADRRLVFVIEFSSEKAYEIFVLTYQTIPYSLIYLMNEPVCQGRTIHIPVFSFVGAGMSLESRLLLQAAVWE